MERLWTRDFFLVTLSTFFIFMNLQMITPALSTYIQHGIGSNSVIGLSTAAWAVSAVVTRILSGKLMTSGSKRKLLFVGLVAYVAATAGYFLATSILPLLVIRILYGIGFGLTTTTFGTLAADVIPHRRIGEGMGYFGLSTSLAMAIAPLIGIGLYNAYGFSALVEASTALVVLATFAMPFILTLRTKRAKAQVERTGWHMNDFYDKAILLPCVLLLLLSITYGGVVSFITLYGQSIHVSNVGWFFLVNAGAVVLVRPFSGQLFDRKGHVAVLPAGAVFLMSGLLLLSYAQNMALLLIAAIFYGMGYGVIQPALQAWMYQRLRPEQRGIGSGAFYNSMDFGIAVGSLILGVIANAAGYMVMYRISAVCMVLFLAFYLVFGVYRPRVASTHSYTQEAG